MDENQLAVDTAKQGEQIKTLFSAMGKIEKRIEGVEKIASSVERLAASVEVMTKNMENIEEKIDDITEEPAAAWKNFKWMLVGTLTTAFVGGVAAALFALVVK